MKWNLDTENMTPGSLLLFLFFCGSGAIFFATKDAPNAPMWDKQLSLWMWLVSGWLWATYLAAVNLPIRRAVKGEKPKGG